MRKSLAIAGMIIVSWAASATSLAAQTLEKIKERGVLVVGTKADYKPFGFRDPTGAIIGFEPDLAKDVADRLGVKLQVEPVVSANRMQFLQQGKIDLMLATMNVTDERRKTVGIVEPSYYASGVNVFANRKANLKRWEDLKSQKVCGIQGAFYNKYIGEKYGADIVAFRGHQRRRPRFPRAIASPGSTTTPPSPSASPIPNGRASICRWRRSSPSRGASRCGSMNATGLGAVHGENHRRLAPQRKADRAREEMEHLAVGVPEKSASRREVSTAFRRA